ncbi:MAG: hypothetical protein FWD26_07905, partial [Treponema sp.]|nr:hypothetical protein [Treponema sp.]
MPNPSVFVPYSINRVTEPYAPFELYTIQSSDSSRTQGKWEPYDQRDPKKRDVKNNTKEKLDALQVLFKQKGRSRIFQLIKEINNLDAIIHDGTPSIMLGLYLTLFREFNGIKFNAKWNTITITGDIRIKNDKVSLHEVDNIEEKYKDFTKDIENYTQNIFSNNLFIYVSNKIHKEIEFNKRITVKHFYPQEPIESVIRWVFDRQWEDGLQNFLCKNFRKRTHNIDFVKTKKYQEFEDNLHNSGINGYFILGEGESGKSDMAEALARSLVEEEKVYAPIWIYVANDKLKQSQNYNTTLEGAIGEYISNEIKKKGNQEPKVSELTELTNLAEFLQQHKYLLVVDNLEIDNVNDILRGIKRIIGQISNEENNPYLIITSRTANESAIAIAQEEMNLEIINPPELSKDDIDEIFIKIIGSDTYYSQYEQNDKYREFVDVIHENFRSYPGLIIPTIHLIKNGKI